MKIVVTASGPALDGPVNPRFGRCSHFIFVDTESGAVEVTENAAVMSGSGAGIQAAQFVVQEGVQAVLTGNVGPNAFQVLNAADVDVYPVLGATVQQAVDSFKAGRLSTTQQATGPSHVGMGAGMGRGMGRGMGMGRGRQQSAPPSPTPTQPASEQSELSELKQEIADLREAVATLLERVDKMTKA